MASQKIKPYKNISATLLLLFLCCNTLNSQVDTIFFSDRTLACRIREVSDAFIYYQLPYKNSPLFVSKRNNILAYKLATDNTLVKNPELKGKRRELPVQKYFIVKVNPLSYLKNYFSLGFEQNIARSLSVEGEVGYITSQINSQYHPIDIFPYTMGSYEGMFIRPSVKWLYTKTRKIRSSTDYYLRLDITSVRLLQKDVTVLYGPAQTQASDISIQANALTLNFGMQIFTKYRVTLDAYFGVGATNLEVSGSPKNPQAIYEFNYMKDQAKKYYNNIPSYYRYSPNGLVYSSGIRIGYKLTDK